MLRYVVALDPPSQNADPELHHFPTFQEADTFAVANKLRFIECYSEERIKTGDSEIWNRHATYNIYADPNK